MPWEGRESVLLAPQLKSQPEKRKLEQRGKRERGKQTDFPLIFYTPSTQHHVDEDIVYRVMTMVNRYP
jgi:hypothetical protein